jgi:UDP-N-acetylmuramoylalanine--D-glutamate ligase
LINDSKATSYSSSLDVLKSLKKVFWIVGGIPKKGDKFLLSKKDSLNIKAYIFGKNRNYFVKHLKNKVKSQVFKNLERALKKIVLDIKLEKNDQHKTILFSPSAASFDSFKNFEDRGKKFNLLVKKLKIKKLIYD